MTEREAGEFIATQEAMAEQIKDLKISVAAVHKQQQIIINKLSAGRGFIVGLLIASGGIGATAATALSKFIGGS